MSAPMLLATVAQTAADAAKPGSPPPITFVVTAFFAIAVFLLGFDLVRRIRRARFRSEIHENLAGELAEHEAHRQDPTGGPASGPAASDRAENGDVGSGSTSSDSGPGGKD